MSPSAWSLNLATKLNSLAAPHSPSPNLTTAPLRFCNAFNRTAPLNLLRSPVQSWTVHHGCRGDTDKGRLGLSPKTILECGGRCYPNYHRSEEEAK